MDNLQVNNGTKDGTWLDSENDESVEYLKLMALLVDEVLSFTDNEFEEYKTLFLNHSSGKKFVWLIDKLEKIRNTQGN